MTSRNADSRAVAMLVLVMMMWAGNAIVGRAIRFEIPPFTLAFVRWTGALLILMPFAAKHLWADRAALSRGWKILLLLGVAGVAAFNGFLYVGLRYTTATNALLFQAAIPALVLLFDFLLFRERSSVRQIVAVLVSTFGVFVIIFRGDPGAVLGLHFGRGDLLLFGAIVSWALYTVLLRLRPAVSPSSFIAATFVVGVVIMAPLAATEWRGIAAMSLTPRVLGAFAYVALLPSLVAYLIYNAAVARIGPARAGQAITLLPLFGAILSAMLLGEVLHDYHFAGMILILLGIVIAALHRRRKEAG